MLFKLDQQSASGATTALGLIEEDPPDLPRLNGESLQSAAADRALVAVCDEPDAIRWRKVRRLDGL